MAPSPIRVATHHLVSNTRWYWQRALTDLQKISGMFESLAKRPGDETLLRRTLAVVDKADGVFIWAWKVLPPGIYAPLRDASRDLRTLVKSKVLDVEATQTLLHRYKELLQRILDSTAPEHFAHLGFKFDNPEHLPWEVIRIALDGVAFLKTMFQKRGVSAVLDAGIRRIIVVPTEGTSAHFNSDTREMTVSTHGLAKIGRFSDTFAGETLIHEFGHFIHRNFITGEAAAAWDAPWKGIPTLADPQNRHLQNNPDRARKLEPLDIVTDYGKVDQYEDFAETFLVFMIAPAKLSPTAMYRMQRTLSLSGLYGKPVMKIGGEFV